ncbi:MAG: spermidine/putrescine ABC transporter substrate-binding protein [Actinobacteria bacterium]|nr:spermidine/putrescine ABC transporter substrate-binding protein [Actinomycetota bacterium]
MNRKFGDMNSQKFAADNSIPEEVKNFVKKSLSRRSVLAGVGGVGAAVALSACSSGGSKKAAANSLRWANWTLYLDYDSNTKKYPTLEDFKSQSGIDVSYKEDINDNAEFFGKVKDQLALKKDIGYDLVTLTDWMAAKWVSLGYTQPLDEASIPNKKNLLKTLATPAYDPTRSQTMTWQGVMAGFGWNKEKVPGGIKSMDQLFSPKNKGKIEVLSEMRDTIGIIMSYQGVDISKPFTNDQFMNAVDFLKKKISDGFIRQVKGNDYKEDLISGDAVAVIGWSGDLFQLAIENDGKFDFAIPESGGTISGDNFMVPVTSTKATEASKLINYYFDPLVAAKVAAYVNYVCPVVGAQEAMGQVDANLQKSEFIFPTEKTLSRLKIFRPLTDAEQTSFETAFQSAAGNA